MDAALTTEGVIGLLFFGLCGFFVLKTFLASFRMDKAGEKLDDYIHRDKKYYYIIEILWPFSLFTSKDKHVKERRYHFVDMLFYASLLFFAMMSFALLLALLQ